MNFGLRGFPGTSAPNKVVAFDDLPTAPVRTRNLVATLALAGATQWDVPGLDGFSEIELEFENLTIGTATATMRVQTSADGGRTFQTTGYSSSVLFINSGGQSGVNVTNGLVMHYQNYAGDQYDGAVHLRNFKDALTTYVDGGAQVRDTPRRNFAGGRYLTARAENAIRLIASTAPSAGTCRVWGRP